MGGQQPPATPLATVASDLFGLGASGAPSQAGASPSTDELADPTSDDSREPAPEDDDWLFPESSPLVPDDGPSAWVLLGILLVLSATLAVLAAAEGRRRAAEPPEAD